MEIISRIVLLAERGFIGIEINKYIINIYCYREEVIIIFCCDFGSVRR